MECPLYGWVVYPLPETDRQRNSNAFEMMIDAARKNGIRIDILFAENITLTISNNRLGLLHKGKEVEKPLFAVMRCYDEHLSRHLEFMGVRLFNSHRSMINAQDKITTHQLLTLNGIPSPRTYWGTNSYQEACKLVGNPVFIVKSPVGSKGEAVFMVTCEADFSKHPHTLAQEYIEASKGRDIRVWVIGNRAIAAVERYNEGSFLSNFAQGGSARKFDLTPAIADLAVRSSRALGLEFSGVDILYTKEETYTVCEVNGNAGFRTLWLTDRDINILDALFKYISDTLLEKSSIFVDQK